MPYFTDVSFGENDGLNTLLGAVDGFKTILESIKSGQMEAMDRIEKIEKKVFESEWEFLVPQELAGLVVFKFLRATGNLYALVKKKENFEGAEVTLQLQTSAMITEMKFSSV